MDKLLEKEKTQRPVRLKTDLKGTRVKSTPSRTTITSSFRLEKKFKTLPFLNRAGGFVLLFWTLETTLRQRRNEFF